MPLETQTGKAVIYGITNDGTAIAMDGYASFILDSADAGHKFTLTEVKDENVADANLIASNPFIEVDITWTPSGASRAAAAATAVFLAPLTVVALSHFKIGAFNGDFLYIGDGTIKITQGVLKMSFKLRKYDDDTQNTLLTTVVEES